MPQVFEDADIDLAVDGAMASKFRNAGQTCVCADRFVVHRSVEDEFVSKLADRVRRLTVGHGTTDGVTMGPVISAARVKILKDRVDDAISEGATCVVGGSPLAELGPNYFSPTILTNVCTRSSIWHGENFGPIVAVRTFDTEEEAILLANDTRTGLASYFFTRDMSRVFRVSSALENGIVGVNEGIISTASAPFGGVKESGLGREGSSAGINEYLETKYVFLNA
jgi:succinate-semialdehyde dehydrogenase/glutarate-semialdehyde dehydrogenase